MIFENLKDKCEYYRSLSDYRLMPNSYSIIMVDGKNFSRLVKRSLDLPFDKWFVKTMNALAVHICEQISSIKCAFVQSDEISFLLTDKTKSELVYNGRLCKIQSIVAGIASSFFTKEIIKKKQSEGILIDEIADDYLFDCKVWNVPAFNDARAWFQYRQIDCIRNSKQQFAQTYCSHNDLLRKNTDEQIKYCLEKTKKDWNDLPDGYKIGRFVTKAEVEGDYRGTKFIRYKYKVSSKYLLTDESSRKEFEEQLKEE